MSEDITHAPIFLADGRGVVVLEPGPNRADRIVTAQELRARADAADLLERIAKGRQFFSAPTVTDAIHLGLEGEPWIVDAPDHPEVAKTNPDAWIWKIDGAPGRLFLSSEPPPADPRIVPACARDFPRAQAPSKLEKRERTVRLMKGPTIEKQLVLGIVLEPEVTDSQGDIYDAQEIENAAHNYLERYQVVGHQHETALPDSAVRIVESYIAPVDFEINGQPVKAGTWLMMFHALSDALWEQIKNGTLTGLSIGGAAQRVPISGT